MCSSLCVTASLLSSHTKLSCRAASRTCGDKNRPSPRTAPSCWGRQSARGHRPHSHRHPLPPTQRRTRWRRMPRSQPHRDSSPGKVILQHTHYIPTCAKVPYVRVLAHVRVFVWVWCFLCWERRRKSVSPSHCNSHITLTIAMHWGPGCILVLSFHLLRKRHAAICILQVHGHHLGGCARQHNTPHTSRLLHTPLHKSTLCTGADLCLLWQERACLQRRWSTNVPCHNHEPGKAAHLDQLGICTLLPAACCDECLTVWRLPIWRWNQCNALINAVSTASTTTSNLLYSPTCGHSLSMTFVRTLPPFCITTESSEQNNAGPMGINEREPNNRCCGQRITCNGTSLRPEEKPFDEHLTVLVVRAQERHCETQFHRFSISTQYLPLLGHWCIHSRGKDYSTNDALWQLWDADHIVATKNNLGGGISTLVWISCNPAMVLIVVLRCVSWHDRVSCVSQVVPSVTMGCIRVVQKSQHVPWMWRFNHAAHITNCRHRSRHSHPDWSVVGKGSRFWSTRTSPPSSNFSNDEKYVPPSCF